MPLQRRSLNRDSLAGRRVAGPPSFHGGSLDTNGVTAMNAVTDKANFADFNNMAVIFQ